MNDRTIMNYRIKEQLVTATLRDISWERIFVQFDVLLTFQDDSIDRDALVFYAVNGKHAAKARLKILSVHENLWRLQINMTNNGENRCLPTGTYRLLVCLQDDVLAECECSFSYPIPMADRSRNFIFANGSGVCAVDFYIPEVEDSLPFRMRVLLAAREDYQFPSNPPVTTFASWLYHYLTSGRVFLRNCYRIFRRLYAGRRKNTILFMTEQSDVLKSNLKAVYERMLARGMDKEYRILVSARASSSSSHSYLNWIHFMQVLAQSGTIFLDDHAPILDWVRLYPDTKVIQLWHAGAGFKSSGYSRWGHQGCPAPQSCHRQYTYGISGSKSIAPFFSEVWGINDELVLPTGMPRMDEFLDEDYRERTVKALYEQFPFCRGKKVVLFAPTYRGKNKRLAYYPYELIDFDRFYQLCGDRYVVLFKMHPWVSAPVPIPEEYRDRFADVNHYPNINDLFYITDLLITDYSSNIFEYSLMKNPMMFFAFDKIQYSFSRGFHRPYEESAPGKVCYTFDELMDAFEKEDFEQEKVQQYVDHHFDFIDTHASDRVIDWIIRGELPEHLKKDIERVEAENARMNSISFPPPEAQQK